MTSTRWRVLVTCPHLQRTLDDHRDRFERHGIDVDAPPVAQLLDEAKLLDIIDRYDGVIAGDDELTGKVLQKGAPRLKTVAKWGIGLDAIDLDAAARLGITVTNTPGAFGDEVADVAIGYVLLLARRLHLIDRGVRDGQWPKLPGVTLRGRTLGVVGLGSTGRAMAERGAALGMEVVGFDVAAAEAPGQIRVTGLDDLLAVSDYVSLHCNLTPDNHHLLDRPRLRSMKRGAHVVNVARGPLVDEPALIDALADGHLGGAALDVFEEEPLPLDSPLRKLPNVILGSHNASNTDEAVRRVSEQAIGNLIQSLEDAEEKAERP